MGLAGGCRGSTESRVAPPALARLKNSDRQASEQAKTLLKWLSMVVRRLDTGAEPAQNSCQMTSAAHSRGTKFFIVGGAGFIGSHVTDRLLASREIERVTLYDNFSSGRDWHYAHHASDPRLAVIRADVKDLPCLRSAMDGHDVVIDLASNPDIARAAVEPDIDFREGTVLTQNVVEAMRTTNTKRVLYTSGSGVYGDVGELETNEDWGPLIPISTYAASKLAGEALISSYCAMFDLTACVFRFANVVGPRQTHGVGFDFLRKLADDPTTLRGTGRWHAEQVVHRCSGCAGRGLPGASGDTPAIRGLQRRHRRLHHRAGNRPSRRRLRWARARIGPLRVHRWRPRLEGRRAHRSPELRSHPVDGLALSPVVSRGA